MIPEIVEHQLYYHNCLNEKIINQNKELFNQFPIL